VDRIVYWRRLLFEYWAHAACLVPAAYYSNRVRGCGEPTEPAAEAGEEHKPRRRASPSWGRLIAKVYQVDPLVCTRCGQRVKVVAFVTDSAAIGHILDHLSTPELEKPPPPVREMLRVAEDGEGWGVPQAVGLTRRARLPTEPRPSVPFCPPRAGDAEDRAGRGPRG